MQEHAEMRGSGLNPTYGSNYRRWGRAALTADIVFRSEVRSTSRKKTPVGWVEAHRADTQRL